MEFLYPHVLWGLLLLIIPILLHLFSFRRTVKVYFSQTRFIKEITEERSTRRNLKRLLILIMRCLAIAALVLAFARPYFPGDNAEQITSAKSYHSIFIDNSFSMEAENDENDLFHSAKSVARDIIMAQKANDQFQILTHDVEGRHQKLVSREQVMKYLNDLEISPSVRELSEVLKFQNRTLDPYKDDNRSIFILSDFQKNISDLSEEESESPVYLLPFQGSTAQNISIDSVWFLEPLVQRDYDNTLYIKIINYSNKARTTRIRLQLKDEQRPLGSVEIPPHGSIIDTVNLRVSSGGWHRGSIIIDDFPISYDNRYFFSFYVPDDVKILHVYEGNSMDYLSGFFTSSLHAMMEHRELRKLDHSVLDDYDLVILNNVSDISTGLVSALGERLDAGGNIAVFPDPMDSAIISLLRLGSAEKRELADLPVASLNVDDPFYSGMFVDNRRNIALPVVNQYLEVSPSRGNYNILSRYRNGDPALLKIEVGQGSVFLFTTSLDPGISNYLSYKELLIPLLYKMAILSRSNEKIGYTIGKDELIPLDRKVDEETHIEMAGQNRFIPRVSNRGRRSDLILYDHIHQAGHFAVTVEGDTVQWVSFNYNRRESDPELVSLRELKALPNPPYEVIENIRRDPVLLEASLNFNDWLWWYLLILALIFIILEILILRFFQV